jgi:hypothetical protein
MLELRKKDTGTDVLIIFVYLLSVCTPYLFSRKLGFLATSLQHNKKMLILLIIIIRSTIAIQRTTGANATTISRNSQRNKFLPS